MNDLQIFIYGGEQLRTVQRPDGLWWVLRDVCQVLGLAEPHRFASRLDDDEKGRTQMTAPQVAYKETIKKAVDQDTKYARQSGGKGQYGHVKIHVEPNESGKGYEFVNAIVGGAIPKEYIPAVDAGIQGAMNAGVVAGFPVVDVKVTLYDGSYHEVDSSEMAFKIAGSMAFKEACRKARHQRMFVQERLLFLPKS